MLGEGLDCVRDSVLRPRHGEAVPGNDHDLILRCGHDGVRCDGLRGGDDCDKVSDHER